MFKVKKMKGRNYEGVFVGRIELERVFWRISEDEGSNYRLEVTWGCICK